MIKDMTEGNVNKTLLLFTLPMLISVMFQQFYNMADSIIVGKFVGEEALAAVGSSYTVTTIFIAVAVGSSLGCNIVIANLFGSKDYRNMKTTVNTVFISCFVLSLVMTVLGLKICVPLMDAIKTPANVYDDALLYLRIYIYGLTFLLLYNVCNGIFTALGDSKTPLIFLICSSIGNIFLDAYFVIRFNMGVAGVAWATFIAQGISSVLALITVLIRLRKIKSDGKPGIFSFRILGNVCVVAIPSILQQSFISVGNLFIQRLVNLFGSSVIAGYSSAIKINTFAITSFTALGNSMSSFTAQNMGAGKTDRIKEGYRAGVRISLAVAAVFFAVFFIFGKQLLYLFLDDTSEQALKTGMLFLKIVSPFYFSVTIKIITDGLLRGSKAMLCFTASTFFDLILRVVLAYLFVAVTDIGSTAIWLSWPIGWVLSTLLSVFFYRRGSWLKNLNKTV